MYAIAYTPDFMGSGGMFYFQGGGGGGASAHHAGRSYLSKDIDGLTVWRNDDGSYGWEAEKPGWMDLNENNIYDLDDLDLQPGQGNDNIRLDGDTGGIETPGDLIDWLAVFVNVVAARFHFMLRRFQAPPWGRRRQLSGLARRRPHGLRARYLPAPG